jgi:type IV pilus assembly protein PilN
MPRINLLPWREKEREKRKRQFLSISVGAVIFMGLVIVLVHIEISNMTDNQNARNKFLEQTIKKVEKEIEEIRTLKEDKKALLARMEVIQKLQRSRPEIVHIFEEVANATPKGVYLINTSRTSNMLEIEGVANSNDNVSAFMRQLNASPWLNNPRLEVIDSSKNEFPNSSWFKLKVQQADQTSNEAEENKEGSKS